MFIFFFSVYNEVMRREIIETLRIISCAKHYDSSDIAELLSRSSMIISKPLRIRLKVLREITCRSDGVSIDGAETQSSSTNDSDINVSV